MLKQIGILPYLYFLLLKRNVRHCLIDWKTAVFILPSTHTGCTWIRYGLEDCRIYTSFYLFAGRFVCGLIGRLPYLYFLLLVNDIPTDVIDWKTAVFILPSTTTDQYKRKWGLEDCRIYTSFYCNRRKLEGHEIGRLPYLYFLLLLAAMHGINGDWKTAVFILPSTAVGRNAGITGLEDCRIYTSFYYYFAGFGIHQIGRLPYLYFLLLVALRKCFDTDWKTAVFILPSTIGS